MNITCSEIRQFQQLYRTKFGIELDDKSCTAQIAKSGWADVYGLSANNSGAVSCL
jgi:hypothetical protein